ncbi:MAG: hypothetical protein MUF83_06195 [Acidimicrobiales bacterium]|jgi:hypothetical protein|nr:hypothetical protein [Acidimicrobiales bacterium]
MTDVVAEVSEQVRGYLEEFLGSVEDEDGALCFRYGSARVFVRTEVWDEDSAVVKIDAPLVTGAEASPELFRHIATHEVGPNFGHLKAVERDGVIDIHFGHTLLGEHLQPAQLRLAVVAVAYGGDQLDDDLVARFGGRRWYED